MIINISISKVFNVDEFLSNDEVAAMYAVVDLPDEDKVQYLVDLFIEDIREQLEEGTLSVDLEYLD